jgi:hypothetical protein
LIIEGRPKAFLLFLIDSEQQFVYLDFLYAHDVVGDVAIEAGMVGDNQLIGRTRLRVGREDGFSIRVFQWQILEETVRGEGLEEVAVISYGTAIDGFLRKVVAMIVRGLSRELLHVCGCVVMQENECRCSIP